MQGPLTWIQRRSPQDLLTRTCARSCKGLSQHFTRISTRSFHKELYKTLTKIFAPGPLSPKRISQDRHKRTCCCWRGSYCKILIQEPPKSIPEEELSYKHLKKQGIFQIFIARNSYTSSCKDLLEDFNRIFTKSSRACARSWSRASYEDIKENPTRSSKEDLL